MSEQTSKGNSNKGKAKSGLMTLPAEMILFHEGDVASSLYIIQKGQLRLFRPKGKGYIELAVLHPGEVIGEMAYFDDNNRGRSCSAITITETEVVEISFEAFGKAIGGLNPWFKTIVHTLANRLRKANLTIKELEINSVGLSYGDPKNRTYHFFRGIDVVRLLSIIALLAKGFGHPNNNGGVMIPYNLITYYSLDIFGIHEAKLLEFLELLKKFRHVEIGKESKTDRKVVIINKVDEVRDLLTFYNTQRILSDDKKLKIGDKSQYILEEVMEQMKLRPSAREKGKSNITKAFEDLSLRRIDCFPSDLDELVKAGFLDEPVIGENNILTCDVYLKRVRKAIHFIRISNAIKDINKRKDHL